MRPLPLMLLGCLLLGCSSPPVSDRPDTVPSEKTARKAAPPVPATSENRHQLSGTLLTPPSDSVVELAVLLVDARGQPRELLESLALSGTGQALPFTLSFTKAAPPADLRLQLRVRVSVSGRLVQRLPDKFISLEQNSNLGVLRLVPAP